MFFTLLIVTLLVAAGVAFGTVQLFNRPIEAVLRRIVSDEISSAWHRYIKFAAFVVGISGGVRVHQLERYISAPRRDDQILELTPERWTLEIFRTVIETLQSMAWLYLTVFLVALVAYVIVRGFELRRARQNEEAD